MAINYTAKQRQMRARMRIIGITGNTAQQRFKAMANLYTLRIGFKGRPNYNMKPTNPEKKAIWRDWFLQEEKLNKARAFLDKNPEIVKVISEMGIDKEDVYEENGKSFIETYNPQRLDSGRDLPDSGEMNTFYNVMGLFDSELNIAIYNYYKSNGGLEN